MPATMITIEVTVADQEHLENISSDLALQFATKVKTPKYMVTQHTIAANV